MIPRLKPLFSTILFLMCMLCFSTLVLAETLSVATGKPSGGYHNSMFQNFVASVKRIGGDQYDVEKAFPDRGTDGSKQNIRLVNAGEEANVGFIQYDAYVLEAPNNVEVFGPIGYEVANLAVKKGGKVDACDDLEKKGMKVGMNSQGGSAITWGVYGKVDSDYTKTTVVDVDMGAKAINLLQNGEIDAYYWVSAPGTKDHQRFLANPAIEMVNCTDGDFDNYKVNGTALYPKVKLNKAVAEKLSYGKKNLTTHYVPAYLVVNRKLLDENPQLYDLFTDVAAMMYANNKALNAAWYPES
jgi:TRAP-type uncharacterized transport system substrate-binding protein